MIATSARLLFPATAILPIIVPVLLVGVIGSPASAFDEQPERLRPVEVDPLSRQFMAPMREDFVGPEEAGFKHEVVRFRNLAGTTLRGWYFPVEGAEFTVLFCMGNTGNVSMNLPYAQLLIDGGFNVLLFDYQGYGGSDGVATALSLFSDACSAFDYLTAERQIAPTKIGVFGVSLGSPLAIAVAATRKAGAVATEDLLLPTDRVASLRASLPDNFASRLAMGTLESVVIPQIDPLLNIPKLECPLLLMHGEHDRLIPPTSTIRAAALVKSPKRVWIMSDTGHAPESLEVNDQEYALQICDFFRQSLSGELKPEGLTFAPKMAGDGWITDVVIEAAEPAAWRITLASARGEFHFERLQAGGGVRVAVPTRFEPTHCSAVAFQNAVPGPNGSWTPRLSGLSESLSKFKAFQRLSSKLCPVQRRQVEVDGEVRPQLFRSAEGWSRLRMHIPEPDSVHSRVRPRYALLLGAMRSLLRDATAAELETLDQLIIEFQPTEPDREFLLNNGGFRLGLRDRLFERSLVEIARRQFQRKQLDEARNSLVAARRYSPLDSAIQQLDPSQLTLESDFDRFLQLIR